MRVRTRIYLDRSRPVFVRPGFWVAIAALGVIWGIAGAPAEPEHLVPTAHAATESRFSLTADQLVSTSSLSDPPERVAPVSSVTTAARAAIPIDLSASSPDCAEMRSTPAALVASPPPSEWGSQAFSPTDIDAEAEASRD